MGNAQMQASFSVHTFMQRLFLIHAPILLGSGAQVNNETEPVRYVCSNFAPMATDMTNFYNLNKAIIGNLFALVMNSTFLTIAEVQVKVVRNSERPLQVRARGKSGSTAAPEDTLM